MESDSGSLDYPQPSCGGLSDDGATVRRPALDCVDELRPQAQQVCRSRNGTCRDAPKWGNQPPFDVLAGLGLAAGVDVWEGAVAPGRAFAAFVLPGFDAIVRGYTCKKRVSTCYLASL